MNKPLSEWTLGEIKQRCDSCCAIPDDCVGCPARRANGDCAIGEPFGYWDLSEPPRWTEQDVEDAKALKRMIKNAHHVRRCVEEVSLRLYGKYDDYILTLNNCFAALPPQTEVTLDEIIGGAE